MIVSIHQFSALKRFYVEEQTSRVDVQPFTEIRLSSAVLPSAADVLQKRQQRRIQLNRQLV